MPRCVVAHLVKWKNFPVEQLGGLARRPGAGDHRQTVRAQFRPPRLALLVQAGVRQHVIAEQFPRHLVMPRRPFPRVVSQIHIAEQERGGKRFQIRGGHVLDQKTQARAPRRGAIAKRPREFGAVGAREFEPLLHRIVPGSRRDFLGGRGQRRPQTRASRQPQPTFSNRICHGHKSKINSAPPFNGAKGFPAGQRQWLTGGHEPTRPANLSGQHPPRRLHFRVIGCRDHGEIPCPARLRVNRLDQGRQGRAFAGHPQPARRAQSQHPRQIAVFCAPGRKLTS